MSEQMLIGVCAVLSLGGLAGIVSLLVASKNHSAESRLDSRSSDSPSHRDSRLGSGSGVATGNRGASRSAQTSKERTANRLRQAGLYRNNSAVFYLAVKVLLSVVPLVVGVTAGLLGGINLLHGIAIGAVLGLLGTLIPSFWLDARKRGRQTRIRRALPDALDIVVTCVGAGLSLPAAISRVGRELQTAHPMLAAEMMIVEREIQLGCSTGEAIKRFAERFDLSEVRSLASVILQAEKFGSSITQALKVHAEELRRKRFQEAEERAQKASVKLLIPTILFIFPALYVVLLGPAVYDIIEFLGKLNMR